MAIGWMTALKMVPWGDVIENAPNLVNGAKKLFTKTRADTPAEAPTPTSDIAKAAPGADADQRIVQLSALLDQSQTRIATLETESRDTAALLKSMAEQQQTMISAIDILGRRSNLLVGITAALAVICVALAVTLVMR
jgi:hypothetical protein